MHDVGLNGRLRPGRGDCFGEPGEPVAADDEHVTDATVGELRAHRRPELGALGGLDRTGRFTPETINLGVLGDFRD